MKTVKAAIYLKITSDAALMARLGNTGPFPGRLPKDSPHSREVAAITFIGETTVGRGRKETQTYTLRISSYSHDLGEDVAADLDRLFHPGGVGQWMPLSVGAGQTAYIRREFAADAPDPDSELWQRIVRFRVHFAKA